MKSFKTSNVKEGAVEAGSRRVTEETVPVPDIIQRARGLCCENDRTFETISCEKSRQGEAALETTFRMSLNRNIERSFKRVYFSCSNTDDMRCKSKSS